MTLQEPAKDPINCWKRLTTSRIFDCKREQLKLVLPDGSVSNVGQYNKYSEEIHLLELYERMTPYKK